MLNANKSSLTKFIIREYANIYICICRSTHRLTHTHTSLIDCRVTDEPYNATCSISITVHGSINRWIVCVGVCLCEFRVDLSMCVWTKISFIFLLFFRLSPFLFFFFFSVITFSTISLYYKSICFHFRYLFLYFYLFPDFSFLIIIFF